MNITLENYSSGFHVDITQYYGNRYLHNKLQNFPELMDNLEASYNFYSKNQSGDLYLIDSLEDSMSNLGSISEVLKQDLMDLEHEIIGRIYEVQEIEHSLNNEGYPTEISQEHYMTEILELRNHFTSWLEMRQSVKLQIKAKAMNLLPIMESYPKSLAYYINGYDLNIIILQKIIDGRDALMEFEKTDFGKHCFTMSYGRRVCCY